jgi:hypothetical protein
MKVLFGLWGAGGLLLLIIFMLMDMPTIATIEGLLIWIGGLLLFGIHAVINQLEKLNTQKTETEQ